MTTPTHPVREHLQRHAGPYLLAGVLLLACLYLGYRTYQLDREAERRTQALREEVRANQLANDRHQLSLAMKTFVWAVRNALLQNKPGEINEYFNTLVQARGVREVLLVDPSGKVTLSTNKKNEGVPFRYPAYLLGQDDVFFAEKQPYELSAPVTGPNQRLGTLVLLYAPTPVLPDSSATR